MIPLSQLRRIGSGLVRPECVIAHASGVLLCADWAGEGGIALVDPTTGGVSRVEARGTNRPMRPNGIALEPGGSVLMADLGAESGGVFRLHPDGAVEPVIETFESRPLPPTNFVHRDPQGVLWITVSTRRSPRDLGYRPNVDDGFILRADDRDVRLVADGLGYTNECHLTPDGRHLYVNETFTRRLSRFPLRADGSLGEKEVVCEFGEGTFPDGLTFDEQGGVWITSIVSNRVIRVAPDGRTDLVLEDADSDHLAEVERAWREHRLGRPHLDRAPAARLRNVSSLAFGGPDLRIAYLGCLLGDAIEAFEAPIPGAPPPHWNFPLGALAERLPTRPPETTS
ncbi:SMP-30/gluconolactonase/LRE family protein [Salinarimonas sp.]|uniref:SMP-30/gluconolactonase/LRE family protein n=1 Tax=Salinarimonas sp. TaxID=2766526 RepID=UPI0039187200